MVRFAWAAVAALALVVPAQAAALKVGDAAPTFAGLDSATSGTKVSLDDFKDKDVLVVCTTCNHCPVAIGHEDRMIKFVKEHAGKDSKVAFVAINVNNLEADKLDKMKERVKEKGFNFQYIYDPSQKIAKDLGATRTPEFFVFDKSRKLVYTGSFDDGGMKGEKVTQHYVADAVKATLAGEKVKTPTTKAEGCTIKWDKK